MTVIGLHLIDILVIIPFGILIVASFLTRQEDRKRLDFFYARLRTPVQADHALDDDEVAKIRNDPARCDALKLFPNSSWEFRKWTRNDWFGQIMVLTAAGGVVLLLWLLVNLGK